MKQTPTYLVTLAAAGALLTSPALAHTATAPGVQVAAAGSAMTSTMDHQFVMKAAQGNNAEISMARLALKNSTNATVKTFAQKMISDHTLAGKKLASIVSTMGGPALPMALNPTDAAMRTKLAQMSGTDFDAAYMKGQVAGHQKMAALMQKEASMGTNAALTGFATATLPTVKMHLSMAQKDMSMMSASQ